MLDDRETETPSYEEEEEFSTSSNIPKFIMRDTALKDFITDPHQYIIYEYDFINPKVFYIELLKTLPAKENEIFPRCTLSKGSLPDIEEQLKSIQSEDDFLNDFIDEIDEDDFDEFNEDQIWDDSQAEFDSF
jgi:hypothetical protein